MKTIVIKLKGWVNFIPTINLPDMGFKRAKIVACSLKPNYRVWIQFDDGLEGEVDLSHLVGKGIFALWESVDFFNKVHIDPRKETLSWDKEIDLDPYVLREQVQKTGGH